MYVRRGQGEGAYVMVFLWVSLARLKSQFKMSEIILYSLKKHPFSYLLDLAHFLVKTLPPTHFYDRDHCPYLMKI